LIAKASDSGRNKPLNLEEQMERKKKINMGEDYNAMM